MARNNQLDVDGDTNRAPDSRFLDRDPDPRFLDRDPVPGIFKGFFIYYCHSYGV